MTHSLLRRNIGLLVGVVLTGQILAGLMVVALVLRPQTVRVADITARMLNAISVEMDGRTPEEQARLAALIDSPRSIHMRPDNDPPSAGGRSFPNFMERMFMNALATKLASVEDLHWRTDPEGRLWMRVRLGGTPWWVNMTPPRPGSAIVSLMLASIIAFIVALGGGVVLQRRLDRPLRRLAEGVSAYRPGDPPPRLALEGPREISAVAAAFNDLATRIDAHEQERATMLAGVSHDLRTPLARLRLSIEMMPHDDEELRASAHRQVEQIDRMLGQFLDYARGAETEERRPVAIRALCEQAVQDAAPQQQVRIETDPGLVGRLRPAAITRALANLVANADRYGTAPIIVGARRSADRLVIEVKDHGAGFDPADAAEMTRPFVRADEARQGPGTGLGLAIVDHIVRQQGGTLGFERCDGCFIARISLPIGTD